MVVSAARVPSDLYSHVHHFLVSNGLNKTAKYFKKETNQEYTSPIGTTLIDIFNKFIVQNGEEEVVKDDVNKKVDKKLKKKRKLNTEDEENFVTKKSKKEEIQHLEDHDNTEQEVKKKKKKEKKNKKKEIEKVDENSSEKPVVPETSSELAEVGKDQSVSENGSSNDAVQTKNVPFRRVKAEEIFVPAQLRNNSFEAKRGSSGDWGEKANRDLKFTQGKSFRHEKTKKKRGSYKGGIINTSVNSIKFEDSD
ncbi:nucleolar and coiled-body phosphoprotein 1-like [Hydractinia symbiolongicarpus]|uniref:nucleolar and coiled-body phosphoprotein 1-like n=1 Tax=Hydractinia symbiolongicarpus TaxID=13093 RepID=UPI00254D005F|nr:nucleolar and coiled-body phosphoprotein 1-like [Hydractinia symbiolongicarpus]